ncbi:MAG: pyruvate kinase [Gammaproteobacteria bacterium]|nr:pyruvate kinase [Gammaproteobacteria bacterium]
MSMKSRFRKTKIIATIGPACDDVSILTQMIRSGMNVARLNLSHGNFEEHTERVERIRQAASKAGRRVAIMIDTRGIEIRTGLLKSSYADLNRGMKFSLWTDGRPGDESGVSVSYPKLPLEVSVGDVILLDDGAIELKAESTTNSEIRCRVVHGGILGKTKGVNLPDTNLSMTAVGPENHSGFVREVEFAAANDVDYIAASFIQSGDDIKRMHEILAKQDIDTPIIAKIENKAGVDNMKEIIAEADGMMVARGDLGVELPFGEVPGTQKRMIRNTVMAGKPVITATQMLASMELNPRPTRAEASDVANAILDGSSAIMLSGETAAGKYPIEAVKTMHSLALTTESCLNEFGYLQKIPFHSANVVTEAVSGAVTTMAKDLGAAAIISLSETGFTSRLISKHRPECPILTISGSERVARRLSMNWGVHAVTYTGEPGDRAKIEFAENCVQELGYAQAGDSVIVTAGHTQLSGGTDMIRIIKL